uniref:Uncharacterized protein n=1 Tax=Anguilla anguilla TaxID=7936 RepID=A0A0E9Q7T6_ANGAN
MSGEMNTKLTNPHYHIQQVQKLCLISYGLIIG